MKVLPVLLLLMVVGCASSEVEIPLNFVNDTDLGPIPFPDGEYCCLHSYMREGELFCNVDDVVHKRQENDNCSDFD